MVQRRDHPDHTWFIGKGKADELHELCLAVDADTVVFDNELSPAQQYNLEKLLGRTAIDRTAVILDIFAQNAHTLEGKAQVELALLRYRLPRLRRGATAKLSQQRGGVGTRFGGGETKLEVDRRRIKRRISRLETELDELGRTRQLQRQQRDRSGLAAVTIVGYTNAGKSTLLNTLTDAGVLVRGPPVRHARPDDPPPGAARRRAGAAHRHRRLRAPPAPRPRRVVQEHARGRQPGRLPRPRRRRQRGRPARARSTPCARCSPRSTPPPCPSCSCSTRPTWRPTRPSGSSTTTPARSPSAPSPARASTTSCARSPTGCARSATVVELAVPYDRGDVLAAIHREGEVVSTTDEPGQLRVRARLSDASAGRLAEFVVDPDRP